MDKKSGDIPRFGPHPRLKLRQESGQLAVSRVRDFSRTFGGPIHRYWYSPITLFPASFLNMDKKMETYPDWAIILDWNGAKKHGQLVVSRVWDFSRTFGTPLYQYRNSSIPWFPASFLNMDQKSGDIPRFGLHPRLKWCQESGQLAVSRVRDFLRTFGIPLYQHWNSSIGWFPASFLNMDKKVETYPDWALILAGNGAKKVGNWQCLRSGTFRELSALHYISTITHLLPGFLPVSWTWIKKVEAYPDLALILQGESRMVIIVNTHFSLD